MSAFASRRSVRGAGSKLRSFLKDTSLDDDTSSVVMEQHIVKTPSVPKTETSVLPANPTTTRKRKGFRSKVTEEPVLMETPASLESTVVFSAPSSPLSSLHVTTPTIPILALPTIPVASPPQAFYQQLNHDGGGGGCEGGAGSSGNNSITFSPVLSVMVSSSSPDMSTTLPKTPITTFSPVHILQRTPQPSTPSPRQHPTGVPASPLQKVTTPLLRRASPMQSPILDASAVAPITPTSVNQNQQPPHRHVSTPRPRALPTERGTAPNSPLQFSPSSPLYKSISTPSVEMSSITIPSHLLPTATSQRPSPLLTSIIVQDDDKYYGDDYDDEETGADENVEKDYTLPGIPKMPLTISASDPKTTTRVQYSEYSPAKVYSPLMPQTRSTVTSPTTTTFQPSYHLPDFGGTLSADISIPHFVSAHASSTPPSYRLEEEERILPTLHTFTGEPDGHDRHTMLSSFGSSSTSSSSQSPVDNFDGIFLREEIAEVVASRLNHEWQNNREQDEEEAVEYDEQAHKAVHFSPSAMLTISPEIKVVQKRRNIPAVTPVRNRYLIPQQQRNKEVASTHPPVILPPSHPNYSSTTFTTSRGISRKPVLHLMQQKPLPPPHVVSRHPPLPPVAPTRNRPAVIAPAPAENMRPQLPRHQQQYPPTAAPAAPGPRRISPPVGLTNAPPSASSSPTEQSVATFTNTKTVTKMISEGNDPLMTVLFRGVANNEVIDFDAPNSDKAASSFIPPSSSHTAATAAVPKEQYNMMGSMMGEGGVPDPSFARQFAQQQQHPFISSPSQLYAQQAQQPYSPMSSLNHGDGGAMRSGNVNKVPVPFADRVQQMMAAKLQHQHQQEQHQYDGINQTYGQQDPPGAFVDGSRGQHQAPLPEGCFPWGQDNSPFTLSQPNTLSTAFSPSASAGQGGRHAQQLPPPPGQFTFGQKPTPSSQPLASTSHHYPQRGGAERGQYARQDGTPRHHSSGGGGRHPSGYRYTDEERRRRDMKRREMAEQQRKRDEEARRASEARRKQRAQEELQKKKERDQKRREHQEEWMLLYAVEALKDHRDKGIRLPGAAASWDLDNFEAMRGIGVKHIMVIMDFIKTQSATANYRQTGESNVAFYMNFFNMACQFFPTIGFQPIDIKLKLDELRSNKDWDTQMLLLGKEKTPKMDVFGGPAKPSMMAMLYALAPLAFSIFQNRGKPAAVQSSQQQQRQQQTQQQQTQQQQQIQHSQQQQQQQTQQQFQYKSKSGGPAANVRVSPGDESVPTSIVNGSDSVHQSQHYQQQQALYNPSQRSRGHKNIPVLGSDDEDGLEEDDAYLDEGQQGEYYENEGDDGEGAFDGPE